MDEIGVFEVIGLGFLDPNTVTIDEAGHPVVAGLTNAGLSGWGASVHTFHEDFPETLIPVASGGGGTGNPAGHYRYAGAIVESAVGLDVPPRLMRIT